MWNILDSLTSKQNFYKVQSRRLALSNPSLSSLSQSLTCTAWGWDGCFRVSPNSIRQIQFFFSFSQFLSWTFSSKFYKNYLLDVPRCAYCEDDDNILQRFTFKFKRNNLVDVPCLCILWGGWHWRIPTLSTILLPQHLSSGMQVFLYNFTI